MKFFRNKKIIAIFLIIGMIIFLFCFRRYQSVQKARETFENYYAFRGCTKLLQKETDFGICKVNTGQTIKIVKYQNKWYLDGDLPCGNIFCF